MQTDPVRIATVITIGCVIVACVLGHLWRSVKLKAGFSRDTMHMYMFFFVVGTIAMIAAAGTITGDSVTTLVAAIVGYVFGQRPWELLGKAGDKQDAAPTENSS